MSSPAPARPLSAFARLHAVPAPLPDLMVELQRHLDACLGIDSLVVHWYDGHDRMRDFYADPGWSDQSVTSYLDDYAALPSVYQSTARQRLGAGRVFGLSGEQLRQRPVYETVLRPLGLDAVLNIPLRAPYVRAIVGGARSTGGSGRAFTAAELQRAERLRRPLADLMEQRAAASGAPVGIGAKARPVDVPSPAEALLLVDASGRVLHACAQGRRILALLRMADEGRGALELHQQLAAIGRCATTASTPAPAGELCLSAGRYRLRWRAMGGDSAPACVAVELTRLVRREVRLLGIAREHGLSPRELEVALGLCRGESYEVIGAALGVAVTTVKSAARSLYGRLGVGDRASLARWVDDHLSVC